MRRSTIFEFLNRRPDLAGEKAYWERGYGSDAVKTFVNHVFETSEISKIVLRTLQWNIRAQKCFEKCGFQPCGSLNRGQYDFLLMDIMRRSSSSDDQ